MGTKCDRSSGTKYFVTLFVFRMSCNSSGKVVGSWEHQSFFFFPFLVLTTGYCPNVERIFAKRIKRKRKIKS